MSICQVCNDGKLLERKDTTTNHYNSTIFTYDYYYQECDKCYSIVTHLWHVNKNKEELKKSRELING